MKANRYFTLYLLGLSERETILFTVTVPRGYNMNYKGKKGNQKGNGKL